ncbi:hypothetical protein [Massilia sp. CCM 8734]|uniref:hypothetical protein n=1 Tax=Massilia sp. CCM 8734 TaxID=2609283 RepID=UPI00141D9394|nr:hypothetical protein [Massilia sp. CCM 8734]NHZ96363.1 hypothetical protein [Massilia sp. CCM 8734]
MPELTPCDLRTICQRKWEQLTPTANERVRYCDHCTKAVFALRTQAELSVASAVGRCVAFADDNEIIGVIGEPEGQWDWMETPSDTVKIRFGHTVTVELAEQMRLAFPLVFSGDVNILPDQWITLGTFTPWVVRQLNKELAEQFPDLEIVSETI